MRTACVIATMIFLGTVASSASVDAANQSDPTGRHPRAIVKTVAGAPFRLPECVVIITRAKAQYFRYDALNTSRKTLKAFTGLLIDLDASGRYITPSASTTTIVNVTTPGPLRPGYIIGHIASTLPNAPLNVAAVICEPESAQFTDGTSWISHNADAQWNAKHR
jgi:hypothetical protein